MRYTYFPGCSNHSSSRDYEESTREVCAALGIELVELQDWNCCGTTAVMGVDPMAAMALSARNLALAAAGGSREMVVTCNSCFSTLRRAGQFYQSEPLTRDAVDRALGEVGLTLQKPVPVRHLLDVLLNDVGLDGIGARVSNPLVGLKVVPYYGCLVGRPKNDFDDRENPCSLERLLGTTGAVLLPFEHKARCCGGALMTTKTEVALELCRDILQEAVERGAEVMAVTCPMCHLNLDAYQGQINQRFGTKFNLPILYFTQILGLSFGLREKELGLTRAMYRRFDYARV